MRNDLKGKVALVTGSTNGIGLVIVQVLAGEARISCSTVLATTRKIKALPSAPQAEAVLGVPHPTMQL